MRTALTSRRGWRAIALILLGFLGLIRQDAEAAAPILQLDPGGAMGLVRSLIVTPGGTQLITASDDKVVRIWDLAAGRTARTLRGEIGPGDQGKIYALALSPDARILAVGGRTGEQSSGDHPIRLYDLANGELIGLLRGHKDAVLSLDFSSDGKLLASGGVDDVAIVWDVAQRAPRLRLAGHQGDVNAVRFTRDGARIASVGDDGSLRLWEVADGRQAVLLTGHSDKVVALAVSPRDGTLATGSLDSTIRLWDPKGAPLQTLARQPVEVMSLAYSPDGGVLVAGSGAKPYEVYLWDARSGALRATYKGHDNIVLATAFAPDGSAAISAGGDNNEIHLWHPQTGALRQQLAGVGRPVWAVGFSRDGRAIAWGTARGAGEANTQGPFEFSLRLPVGERAMGEPRPVAPGGNFVRALSSLGGTVLQHRAGGSFGYYANLDVIAGGRVTATIERSEHDGYAHNAYTFTHDGRGIIAGAGHGFLTFYDLQGRKQGEFVGHTGDVWSVAVSPDGQFLLSGSDDQTIRLWRIASRENIASLFHGKNGEWVLWTPQGYYAASPDGDAHVGWQINEGIARAARFVAAAQLKSHFYRPDIVTRALLLGSASRAVDETITTRFSVSDLAARRPPEFAIVTPAPRQTIPQGSAQVRVTVGGNTDPVLAFDVTVNSRRVLSQVPAIAALAQGGAGEQVFLVPLGASTNSIEIAALNAVGRTVREVSVQYTGREERDKRGNLLIIAIGVDDYPNFGQNLVFAGADARAIHRILVNKAGPLHTRVESVILAKEGQALPTAKNIAAALDLLQRAGPDDTVIVFLAGHGVNDGPDYLFLPTDAKLRDKKWDKTSVVSWQRLQDTLEKARGQRIMLVDTCHAGNAFNARLIKDAADARIIVFAATDADTVAQERQTLGHGVFTHAVIQGLNGAADLVPDRQVKVQELSAFVERAVRSLTDGKQQPMFYSSGTADYVISRF